MRPLPSSAIACACAHLDIPPLPPRALGAALITVANDKLLEILPDSVPINEALTCADDILRQVQGANKKFRRWRGMQTAHFLPRPCIRGCRGGDLRRRTTAPHFHLRRHHDSRPPKKYLPPSGCSGRGGNQ